MASSGKGKARKRAKKVLGYLARKAWEARQRRRKRKLLVNGHRATYGVDKKTAKAFVKHDVNPSDLGVSGNVPFFGRHMNLGAAFDFLSDKGHGWMDRRDLVAGVFSGDEWKKFEEAGGNVGIWRAQILEDRKAKRKKQRAGNRGFYWKPIVEEYHIGRNDFADENDKKVPDFKAPKKRKKTTSKPKQHRPVAPRTTSTKRRPDRDRILRNAWGGKFNDLKGKAMTEPNLSAAFSALRSFAENMPADRGELHAHLAAFAAFGDVVAEVSETFKSNLEAPRPDGTPGVPHDVTARLTPVAEAGATISQASQDCANAFEDRFAEAIRVAQDEEKMSDEYLKVQPA